MHHEEREPPCVNGGVVEVEFFEIAQVMARRAPVLSRPVPNKVKTLRS